MVAPSDAGSVLGASASAVGSVLGRPTQGAAATAAASVPSQALVGVPRGNGLTSVPGVGATVSSDLRTFKCAKCLLDKSVSVQIVKGTQLWCQADNNNYNSLSARWRSNGKLKKWWQSLSPTQQADWFIKWQALENKKRFEFIQYIEKTVHAQELIEDEIDSFIPYDQYYRDKIIEGIQKHLIPNLWKEAIDSCKYECIIRRGQWLLPRFDGVKRTTRFRMTQEQCAMRFVNVIDANQMEQLWAGGAAIWDRFLNNLPQTLAVTPTITAPTVTMQQAGQPQAPPWDDVLRGSIHREARRASP